MRSRLFSVLTLCIPAALTGCGASDTITIDSPSADAVHSEFTEETQVHLTYTDVDTSTLVLTLNGEDVTSAFIISDSEAYASLADLDAWLDNDGNTFEVTSPETHSVDFYWDEEGPSIHLLAGDLSSGGSITVSGYLSDNSDISQLDLGYEYDNSASSYLGQVDVDDSGHFTASIDVSSAVNNLFLTATDALGYETSLSLQPASTNETGLMPIVEGLGMRLNDSGLDFIEEEVISYVTSNVDFDTLLESANPLVSETTSVWLLGKFGVEVNASDFEYDNLAMNVVPYNGTSDLDLTAGLQDMEVTVGASLWVFGAKTTTDITIGFDEVELEMLATLTGSTSIDELLDLSISDISVNLTNLSFPSWPSAIETVLDYIGNTLTGIEGAIVGAVEDAVEDAMDDVIPDLVEDSLQLIPNNVTFSAGDLSELLAGSYEVTAQINAVGMSNDGISLTTDAEVEASDSSFDFPGSRLVDVDLPSLEEVSADGSSYDLGAVVSANLLNRTLFAAHQAGDTTISQQVYSGGDLAEVLGSEYENVDMLLSTNPASPPYINVLTDGSDIIELVVDDFELVLEYLKEGDVEYSELLRTTVKASVPVAVGLSSENTLDVAIETLPIFTIQSLAFLGNDVDDSLLDVAETLVDWLLPEVMPTLAAGLVSIPIPAIEGFSLSPVQIWSEDAHHIAVVGDLVTVSAATASRSSVEVEGDISNVPFSISSSYDSGKQIDVALDDADTSLQYRYQLDDNAWSSWQSRTQISLYRVKAGDHQLTVCSRTATFSERCSVQSFSVNP